MKVYLVKSPGLGADYLCSLKNLNHYCITSDNVSGISNTRRDRFVKKSHVTCEMNLLSECAQNLKRRDNR